MKLVFNRVQAASSLVSSREIPVSSRENGAKILEKAEALRLLAKAATLQPGTVRYSYVYAVALHSTGQVDRAIAVLKQAHARRPADREVLMGLVTFERDRRNTALAITYAQQLVQLVPDDPDAKMLLASWRGRER